MAKDKPTNFAPSRLPSYSESDILSEVRRVVALFGGRAPNSAQFALESRISLGLIYRRYGSYSNALAKAGVTYKRRTHRPGIRRRHTPEEILDNLRGVLNRNDGYEFSIEFYRKHGGLLKSYGSINDYLGLTWKGAMVGIGAKRKTHELHVSVTSQRKRFLAGISAEEILRAIDLAWQGNEGYLSRKDFNSRSAHLKANLVASRFGSWSNAIAAFCEWKGIPVPCIPGTSKARKVADGGLSSRRRPATNEELLAEIQAAHREDPSTPISYRRYRSMGGTWHIDTFKSRFGSWTEAVRASGCTPAHCTYSRQDLFDEIQRVWEKLGRQPTVGEMAKRGHISVGTYANQFGSWIKAVHAFCEDRNSDAVDQDEPSQQSPPTEPATGAGINDPPNTPGTPHQTPLCLPCSIVVVRKTGRRVPSRLRWRVLVRDNFTCKACGRCPAKHGIALHADHIVAYTNGGETTFENLEAKCEDCNLGKSNL